MTLSVTSNCRYMTNEQKRQVKDALVRYVNNFSTQSEAAESLKGISTSTISQVKNHNWELLSNRLWQHIASQVGFYCGEWQPADTGTYLLLGILLNDAKHYAMTYGIAIGEGLGKTFTAGRYVQERDAAYYMSCNDEYNRKSFMTTLLNNAGAIAKGTVPELMQQYVDLLGEMEEPVLILDDADKLKDRVLHLVVLLANALAGKAGVVIMGGDKLRSRIIDGVRLKKAGYDDIYRSIGRRFITLGSLGPKDIELVCRANGLHNQDIIDEIAAACPNLHKAQSLIAQQMEVSQAA